MPPKPKNGKKQNQINVKLDAELYERFRAACEIQQHDNGQLARILIDFALPFYERARSVEALNKLGVRGGSGAENRALLEKQVQVAKGVHEEHGGHTGKLDRNKIKKSS